MKIQELRNLIRNEVRRAINESTSKHALKEDTTSFYKELRNAVIASIKAKPFLNLNSVKYGTYSGGNLDGGQWSTPTNMTPEQIADTYIKLAKKAGITDFQSFIDNGDFGWRVADIKSLSTVDKVVDKFWHIDQRTKWAELSVARKSKNFSIIFAANPNAAGAGKDFLKSVAKEIISFVKRKNLNLSSVSYMFENELEMDPKSFTPLTFANNYIKRLDAFDIISLDSFVEENSNILKDTSMPLSKMIEELFDPIEESLQLWEGGVYMFDSRESDFDSRGRFDRV